MLLRQLFDYETWTYTYLLADEESREAVLIARIRFAARQPTMCWIAPLMPHAM